MRWVGYDRPGYGGSTRLFGREVAQAAQDTALIARALDIPEFGVMGHSGGGPHALACAALLPQVRAAVSLAGLAPYAAPGLDYFAGMYAGGCAELVAATRGEAALREALEAGDFDAEMFTPADHSALADSWSWFHSVVEPALEQGLGGMIDDDLAYVQPWGYQPADISVPTLLVNGEQDRTVPIAHAEWLQDHSQAELRRIAGGGHISVMLYAERALDWLLQRL
ncbi:alpha/beta hydrolase [Deinococcus piscis]|uniref:Alpha/beta hydrolase n=1 Tax=Deinococcus piscis TaxID=394230 RepID=A0ABQ3K2S9_9DEIO|nr:alpha/beta hydrolase [Deinococcus piscis]GHF99619.1 alpha/beta hydrolase [Deinococcus piscis]